MRIRSPIVGLLVSTVFAACSSTPTSGSSPNPELPREPTTTAAPAVASNPSPEAPDTTEAPSPPGSQPVAGSATTTPAATAFDYGASAVYQRTSETGMGSIAWYKTSVVPSDWLYSGFPTPSFVADPFGYDRSWARVADAADCCDTITRTADGWIGIGPGGGSGGGIGCASPLAVWESPDGFAWNVLKPEALGADGPCAAAHLVEHRGSAAFFANGRGGQVWVSHGFEEWHRADFSAHEDGTDTYVTAIVAGPSGFAAFGVRVAHEPTARSETGIRLGPYPMEWVGWTSSDGVRWRPVNMAGMFGSPWCKPNHPVPCGYIDAMMTDDGIVAYIHQAADSTVPDMRDGWALWIGLLE